MKDTAQKGKGTSSYSSKIKWRLLALTAAFAVGIVIFGVVAQSAINRVKVGGPIYGKVVEGKDLVADILPPPEYIIESYLTAHELADQSDKAEIDRLQKKMQTLKNDYEARHEYWLNTLADGKMKDTLVDRSYQPVEAFYRAYENKLLPAIDAGDLEKAKEVVRGPLTRHYNAHRAEIDEVVKMANEQNAEVEASGNSAVSRTAWILIGISAFSLVLFVVLGQLVGRSIGKLLAPLADELAAIGKSQAVIEFNNDGTIVQANPNFLNAVGYSLEEIQGQHHRMFCDPAYTQSPAYQEFWAKLNRGEYQAAEYQRFGKGGKEIWIQASYNPIVDSNGKVCKVVKYATDVTAQKIKNADYEGQISAIGKSQAVIEFKMDGTVVYANANFLKTLGYELDEIRGKHHRMFCEPTFAASAEYQAFWAALNRGEYQAAEYKRIGKGGKEIWIQASYNPILDLNGKPFKVVKYASDITEQKLSAARQLARNAKIAAYQGEEVSKVSSVLSAVANGDLTQHYDVAKADEDTADVFGTFSQIASAV
ncbi:MAG: PAS domain-containing protein, partial [Pirellulales bacterium]